MFMPINASPHFLKAERNYLEAQTTQQKIIALKKMISLMPGHKGAENLRKNLKRRLARLKYVNEKESKKSGSKKGIRKEGFQVVMLGLTNSGKSSLLKAITNAEPKISDNLYTTKKPVLGTMQHQGVKAQVLDIPSVGGKDFDYGILHGSDCLLIVIDNLSDLEKLKDDRNKTSGKQIIVFNKVDSLNDKELRKLEETLKSRKMNYVLVSAKTGRGIDELKGKIMNEMGVIRVFMKEPGKEKSDKPAVLKSGATIFDVAESIFKGFSKQVKETRLTGPSGKFSNQRVGMSHLCKDMDIVEFKT